MTTNMNNGNVNNGNKGGNQSNFVRVAGCKFCDCAGRVQDTLDYAPGLHRTQAVYRWGKTLMVTIDKHPVTDDVCPYFLIYPYSHFTSFLNMPDEMSSELEGHIAFCRLAAESDPLTKGLRNRVIFEHGQMKDGNAVKSIYHAHLHALFGNFDAEKLLAYALEEMARVGVQYQVIPGNDPYIRTLHRNIPAGHDYLFFSVNDVKVIALDKGNDQIYSQFFRQIFSRSCGSTFVNWKTATAEQDHRFCQRLYQSLPANPAPWDRIPDWVPGK